MKNHQKYIKHRERELFFFLEKYSFLVRWGPKMRFWAKFSINYRKNFVFLEYWDVNLKVSQLNAMF